MASKVYLIPGKEKRVYSRHPWVFRSDIHHTEGHCNPGDVVSIYSDKGRFLAKAFYNPNSQIALRILTWQDEEIDRAFIFRRVHDAVEYRRSFADLRSCRLIFAESDRLPAPRKSLMKSIPTASGNGMTFQSGSLKEWK